VSKNQCPDCEARRDFGMSADRDFVVDPVVLLRRINDALARAVFRQDFIPDELVDLAGDIAQTLTVYEGELGEGLRFVPAPVEAECSSTPTR
jgi:hypothetical protein